MACTAVKALDQMVHCRAGLAAPHPLGRKPDAFGKVQPHVAVGAAFHLFLRQIAQNRTAESTVWKAAVKRTEKGRIRGYVMKIFPSVGTQLLARELAGTPSLVERMGEQVVAGHPCVQRCFEIIEVHASTKQGDRSFT